MTLQRKKSVHIFTGVQAGTLQQRALITTFLHVFVVTPILALLSTPHISFIQTDFSQHVVFICLSFITNVQQLWIMNHSERIMNVYIMYSIFFNFFSHFRNRLFEEQTSFGQVWCSKKDFAKIWRWRGSYHWSVDLCSCKVFCWDMRVNIFFSYSWRKRHTRFPWWPNL